MFFFFFLHLLVSHTFSQYDALWHCTPTHKSVQYNFRSDVVIRTTTGLFWKLSRLHQLWSVIWQTPLSLSHAESTEVLKSGTKAWHLWCEPAGGGERLRCTVGGTACVCLCCGGGVLACVTPLTCHKNSEEQSGFKFWRTPTQNSILFSLLVLHFHICHAVMATTHLLLLFFLKLHPWQC